MINFIRFWCEKGFLQCTIAYERKKNSPITNYFVRGAELN